MGRSQIECDRLRVRDMRRVGCKNTHMATRTSRVRGGNTLQMPEGGPTAGGLVRGMRPSGTKPPCTTIRDVFQAHKAQSDGNYQRSGGGGKHAPGRILCERMPEQISLSGTEGHPKNACFRMPGLGERTVFPVPVFSLEDSRRSEDVVMRRKRWRWWGWRCDCCSQGSSAGVGGAGLGRGKGGAGGGGPRGGRHGADAVGVAAGPGSRGWGSEGSLESPRIRNRNALRSKRGEPPPTSKTARNIGRWTTSSTYKKNKGIKADL